MRDDRASWNVVVAYTDLVNVAVGANYDVVVSAESSAEAVRRVLRRAIFKPGRAEISTIDVFRILV